MALLKFISDDDLFHEVLPSVIEKVYQEELEDDMFTVNDIPNYAQYFELAYGN